MHDGLVVAAWRVGRLEDAFSSKTAGEFLDVNGKSVSSLVYGFSWCKVVVLACCCLLLILLVVVGVLWIE